MSTEEKGKTPSGVSFPKHILQQQGKTKAQRRKQRKDLQSLSRGLEGLDFSLTSSAQGRTLEESSSTSEGNKKEDEVTHWRTRAENAEVQLQAANLRIEQLVAENARQAEALRAATEIRLAAFDQLDLAR